MPLVCPACGAYALGNPARTPSQTSCSACGRVTPANIYPLCIVTGASGSGKTAVIPALRQRLPECVVFDKDLLWGRCIPEQFVNNWLRVAYGVAQGGRYSVICGTLMPWDVDAAEDRGLVGAVHFLNLHCPDDIRAERLRARPAWRGATEEYIEQHRGYAAWQLEHAATKYDPPMPTIDTSQLGVAEVADAVGRWVESVVGTPPVGAPAPHASGA